MSATATIKFPLASLAKSVLLLLLLYVLVTRLFVDNNVKLLFSDLLNRLHTGNFSLLLIVLLLMPINWMMEVQKLYELYEGDMERSRCIRSILCGISVGVVTPARLGEYVGRLLVVKEQERGRTVVATFLMSLSQLAVTLGVGTVALFFLLWEHPFLKEVTSWEFHSLIPASGGKFFIATLVVGLAGIAILSLSWSRVKSRFYENKFGQNLKAALASPPSFATLSRILLLSGVRYLIYLSQYVVIFLVLGVEQSVSNLALHIALIFLVQSLVPLPPIASLVSRSSVAVLVLAPLGINEIVIVTASVAIWVINLMIPAFCGLGIILKLKSESRI